MGAQQPHPPYSPDLTPSDYHLFGLIKQALRGHNYGNDEEAKIVKNWFREQPAKIYEVVFTSS